MATNGNFNVETGRYKWPHPLAAGNRSYDNVQGCDSLYGHHTFPQYMLNKKVCKRCGGVEDENDVICLNCHRTIYPHCQCPEIPERELSPTYQLVDLPQKDCPIFHFDKPERK